jgi:hypothetical protein
VENAIAAWTPLDSLFFIASMDSAIVNTDMVLKLFKTNFFVKKKCIYVFKNVINKMNNKKIHKEFMLYIMIILFSYRKNKNNNNNKNKTTTRI